MPLADTVTLKQLRVLVAVVEAGGVTAAAERLCVTAPAVSLQLKTLEDNVGAPVLVRPSLALTPVGAELFDAARRMEATLARALDRVGALRAGRAGQVALGVTSTAKYFAPALIATIAGAMPELDVSLAVGNRAEIVAGLDLGRIDLAITGRPPRTPMVEATVIGDHPHVWVAAPDHPLVARRGIDPTELLRETILTREEGSGTRSLMERLLGAAGGEDAHHGMVFNSNETIKQAAIARLGIAFLSGHTVVSELEDGRLVLLDVVGSPVVRRWFAVVAAGRPVHPATQRVFDFVVGLRGAFLPRCRTGWARQG